MDRSRFNLFIFLNVDLSPTVVNTPLQFEICSLRALPYGLHHELCPDIGLIGTFAQVPKNCLVDFHEVHALWTWIHCS